MPPRFEISHYQLGSIQICRKLARPVWPGAGLGLETRPLTTRHSHVRPYTVWHGKCYNRASQSATGALQRQELMEVCLQEVTSEQSLKRSTQGTEVKKAVCACTCVCVCVLDAGKAWTKPQLQNMGWFIPECPCSLLLVWHEVAGGTWLCSVEKEWA